MVNNQDSTFKEEPPSSTNKNREHPGRPPGGGDMATGCDRQAEGRVCKGGRQPDPKGWEKHLRLRFSGSDA